MTEVISEYNEIMNFQVPGSHFIQGDMEDESTRIKIKEFFDLGLADVVSLGLHYSKERFFQTWLQISRVIEILIIWE